MSRSTEPAWVRDDSIWTKAKKAADQSKAPGDYYGLVTHIYKQMGGRVGSKETGTKVPKASGSGVQTGQFLFTNPWEGGAADQVDVRPVVPAKPTKAATDPVDADEEVRNLIINNPGMNASTLYNAMKAKGLAVVDTKPAVAAQAKDQESTEADSGSSHASVLRAGSKESANHVFRTQILEGSQKPGQIDPNRFKVILLAEGMGNLKDAHYYTKPALESGVPLFEGKKIYADHPAKSEDENRPERTVRDILGHFENVHVEEAEDGRGLLVADLITLPGEPFEWARALIRHAIPFAKKYPDKDFVGLSINTDAEMTRAPMQDLVKEATIPKSAIPKIQKAIELGVTEVKVVHNLTEAVSADLVTEAGAGGKILQILEQEKAMSKKESKKEADQKSKEAEDEAKKSKETEGEETKDDADKKAAADSKDGDAGKKSAADESEDEKKEDGADGEHDDEDEDKALIKKMLKDYLGDEEVENEKAYAAAKEMYAAQKEMGYEKEKALMNVGESLKMAKHMASKKKETEHDADDKEMPAKKDGDGKEAAKEADGLRAKVAELTGQVKAMEREANKGKLEKFLDKKLRESKLSRDETDEFRKLLGQPKSEAEINRLFEAYHGGLKRSGAREATGTLADDFFVVTEKTTARESDSESDKVDFSKLGLN